MTKLKNHATTLCNSFGMFLKTTETFFKLGQTTVISCC